MSLDVRLERRFREAGRMGDAFPQLEAVRERLPRRPDVDGAQLRALLVRLGTLRPKPEAGWPPPSFERPTLKLDAAGRAAAAKRVEKGIAGEQDSIDYRPWEHE